MKKKYAYICIVLFFIIELIINLNFQDTISKAEGKGYDGIWYYEITEQLKNGEEVLSVSPFCYRIGTPFLSNLLPFDIIVNFSIVNYLATFLGCLLLFYWLCIHIKNTKIALILVLALMSNWVFYIRNVAFYPMSCDPVAYVFILLILILLDSIKKERTFKKEFLLCFLILLGVFFREFLIVFSFAVLFFNNPIDSKEVLFLKYSKIKPMIPLFLGLFLVGLGGNYIVRSIAHAIPGDYSLAKAFYICLTRKSIFVLMSAAFNSIGIWIIFPFFFIKKLTPFFKENHYIIALLAISILISWFTGGDTERFFMWFSPVYFILIGKTIEGNIEFFKKKIIMIPLIVILIFSFRILQPIPQPKGVESQVIIPLFQTLQTEYVDLLSYYGNMKNTTIVFIEYVLAVFYFLVVTRYFKRKYAY